MGKRNTGADALSRNNRTLFLSQVATKSSSDTSKSASSTYKPTDPKHNMDMHSLDGAVQHYFTAALLNDVRKSLKVLFESLRIQLIMSQNSHLHHVI